MVVVFDAGTTLPERIRDVVQPLSFVLEEVQTTVGSIHHVDV